MKTRICRWLLFGPAISLLPIYLAYSDLTITNNPAGLERIIGHGELYIIICVLVAGAAGGLYGHGNAFGLCKVISSAVALYLIVIAAHKFALVIEADARAIQIDRAYIVKESVELFLTALVVSVGCLVVSEL